MMIERVSDHAADQANIVGAGCDVGNVIGKFDAALPVRREFTRAREHRRGRFDEGEPQVLGHRRWERLAGVFLQRGLGVEQIHLARRAFHEQAEDVFGVRREMRSLWSERIGDGPSESFAFEQGGQRERFDSPCATAEERSPRLDFQKLWEIHSYSRVINSSRFSRMRLTPSQSPPCARYCSMRARSVFEGGRATQSSNA